MTVVKAAIEHPQLGTRQGSQLFDDFYAYTSTNSYWTTVSSGGGTSAISTTTDQVVCTTGAGSNDYQGIKTTQPSWLFSAGVGMYAEFYINASATNTDFQTTVGFSSSATVFASLADPSSSYSGAVVYFLPGSTYASFQVSNGSTKTTSVSQNCLWANGTADPAVNHLIRIDVTNWDGLHAQVTYEVDGIIPLDSNGLQINHIVAYSSLAQMGLVAIQASSGSADVLNVDYVSAGKFRQLLM